MDEPVDRHTLLDFPEICDCLEAFTDADLGRVPVVAPGARLEPGALYLDLCRADRAAYHALDGATAPEDACLVCQADVPEPLWHRLLGINNPELQCDEPTG